MEFLYINVKKKRKISQRKEEYMEELRNRLKKYHEIEGVSYKVVAAAIGISTGVMYNFTSEIRNLKDRVAVLLDEYLKEKGY